MRREDILSYNNYNLSFRSGVDGKEGELNSLSKQDISTAGGGVMGKGREIVLAL